MGSTKIRIVHVYDRSDLEFPLFTSGGVSLIYSLIYSYQAPQGRLSTIKRPGPGPPNRIRVRCRVGDGGKSEGF